MVRALGLALLGAGLVVVGSGIAEVSLLALGIALLGYALFAGAWIALAAAGARLDRTGLPARVVEGERFEITLELSGGRAGSPGGSVADPLIGSRATLRAGRRRVRGSASIEGRGQRRLPNAALELRDPLGLVARTVTSEPASILALPRIAPIEAASPGGASGLSAALGAAAAAGGSLEARGIEFEVDGLRPHRPGVPASRIHWPTVARTGEMVERRLAAGEGAAALVVVDSSDPDGEAELDSAVRAAASLVHALAPRGGCALRLSGQRRTLRVGERLEGFEDAHVRLALLEPGEAPGLPRELTARAVFWVAARRFATGPRRLDAPTVLVVPGPVSPDSAFTVAGCAARPLDRRASALAEAMAQA